MKAPGSIFLLITGIIYVVNNIGFVIMGIAVLLFGAAMGFLGLGLLIGFAIILLGAFELIVGMMGISHRNNPKKSGMLMVLGIISLIGSVINFFFDFFSNLILSILSLVIPFLGVFAAFAFSPFMTFLFLVVPIFYIIGAHKNKKSGMAISRRPDPFSKCKYSLNEVLFGPPPSLYIRWASPKAETSSAPAFLERPLAPREQHINDEQFFFKVQVGLFRELVNAQAHLTRLRSEGFNPALERFNSPKYGAVIRVFIPGIRASERSEVAQRLKNAGFKGAWARA